MTKEWFSQRGISGTAEYAIIILGANGIKCNFSAKKLSNPYVDRWLRKVRENYGGGEAIYPQRIIKVYTIT